MKCFYLLKYYLFLQSRKSLTYFHVASPTDFLEDRSHALPIFVVSALGITFDITGSPWMFMDLNQHFIEHPN